MSGGSEREDRLSSLPDEILVEILSYLPIKSAVDTATLSHRWTNLWTHIKSVIISEADFEDLHLDKLTDDLFQRLVCPMFDKVVLSLEGSYDNTAFGRLQGQRFADSLCDLNVREIHVIFRIYCSCPPSIFRTNSLVALHLYKTKLYNNIDCIDLPKLRTLSMRLMLLDTSSCKVLEKVVNSCPNLDDLCIDFFICFERPELRKPLVFHLSSQHLRVLNMNEQFQCSDAQFFRVVIEARNLESFRFYTKSGIHCCFTEDSATLLQGDISLDTYDNYSTPSLDDYHVAEEMDKVKLKLYGSISNVRSLTLDGLQLINTSTMFPNLTCLTLTYLRPDTWKSAIDLLVQCPFLRKLVFRAKSVRPCDEDEPWIPPKIIPTCITTHLKRIEIEIEIEVLNWSKYRVDLSWLKLVRFLLSCATVLERLIITVIGGEYVREIVQESDQVSLFQELYACPRISLCCQVEIYGILKSKVGKERVWAASDDGIISIDKSSN